ncbi:MAG: hypothetical protein HYX93_06360 [Chloroflexi bacterium]|nr:hypothetical protein [Chloroflexota bacterium]
MQAVVDRMGGSIQQAKRVKRLWLMVGFLALLLIASACSESQPEASPEDILKLGFDPSTVGDGEGKKVPGLPAGFTYTEVVPTGKYSDPDVIALDPTEKYLFFVTHLQSPDGEVYRVDLETGEATRLIRGLQRPGGIAYYEPGNVLIVGEEGTGLGPDELKQGFWYAINPDVPDQDIPQPLRAMGQARWEGFEIVSADTMYLGEDQPHGGPIYKYIVDSPPDLTKGTLYVFKKDEGWIKTQYLEAPDTGKEGTDFFAAEDMHIGPDGKLYMVISAQAENKVVAIDIVTAKVTDFVIAKGNKGFERPDQLAFSPNGVLFITAGGEVWAALPDGPDDDTLSDGVFRFLKDLDTVQGIWFTRDGSTFYLSARAATDGIFAISGFNFQ